MGRVHSKEFGLEKKKARFCDKEVCFGDFSGERSQALEMLKPHTQRALRFCPAHADIKAEANVISRQTCQDTKV